MRLILPAAACILAGCSAPPAQERAENAAAATNSAGEAAIATSAASPAPAASISPGQQGGLPDDSTPIGEAPFAEESAQGAAQVIQTYYARIGQSKYREAWALWRDGGQASGMDARAFAASFGKFAEYHAQIGAPGRIEGAAGSRYVTVPVQVYGRLKEGDRPFAMLGTLTLRRSEVDGATPEQRRWRIYSADIKPRPGAATPTPVADIDSRSRASMRCVDGSRFVVRFDPDNARVTIPADGKPRVLRQERVASGIRYAGSGYVLEGKGVHYTLTKPNLPPLPCTVNGR